MNFKLFLIMLFVLLGVVQPLNAQIILNKIADMNFGIIGFDGSHAGEILLGTNGAVTLSGTRGIAFEGGSRAGRVTITGNSEDVIEIRCGLKGSMVGSDKGQVGLSRLEISINSGVVAGSANACQNIRKSSKPVIVHDLAANPNPTILIGATATIKNNGLASGSSSYSSALNSGGSVKLRVIFQ